MQHYELLNYLNSNISNKDTINEITRHLGSKITKTDKITCGYTNEVYKVSILGGFINNKKNIKHKIIKLFKNHDRFVDEKISLALNFPPIDFTNDFIRIEEFIESTPVNLFSDRFCIIDCLRDFHNNETVQRLKFLKGFHTFEELCVNDMKKIYAKYNNQTILKNLDAIFKRLPSIESEYIIHNDLVRGNILKTPENKIFLIDFEYSCIGSKELDLACLIEEMQTDYSLFDSLSDKLENKPSETDLEEMINIYFNLKDKNSIKKKIKEIKRLQSNIQFYHLLWSLNNINGANTTMNYEKYGLQKLMLLCTGGLVKADCYSSIKTWINSI